MRWRRSLIGLPPQRWPWEGWRAEAWFRVGEVLTRAAWLLEDAALRVEVLARRTTRRRRRARQQYQRRHGAPNG